MDLSELLMASMKSVIGEGQCIYAAGPISSSLEHFQCSVRGGVDSEEITSKNRELLSTFARNLRLIFQRPVVDPSVLIVAQWSGADYGRFFLGVIDSFCSEIRLSKGWQYSFGATSEVVHALKKGLPVYDLDEGLLDSRAVYDCVRRADETIRALGVETDRFARRLAALLEGDPSLNRR